MNGFQQFDVRGTDGPMTINAAGNFLRFDSTSGLPVTLRADGQDLGRLWPGESVELPEGATSWIVTADPTETGVVRVGFGRIDSTRRTVIEKAPVLLMQTDQGQVAGGAAAGWVSGTPAGLAPSAFVNVTFDLGPDWDQYGVCEIVITPQGPSSGFSNIVFYGSDTAAVTSTSRRRASNTTGGPSVFFIASLTTAGGVQLVSMRPAGRYVITTLNNADAGAAIGASAKVQLVAYPT